MIVADTNVIVYLMIEGEKTATAQRTIRQDPNWFVPSLWRHEFLNVLVTFVRHGGIEIDEAIDIWQKSTLLFSPGEREVNMPQALRLATADGDVVFFTVKDASHSLHGIKAT